MLKRQKVAISFVEYRHMQKIKSAVVSFWSHGADAKSYKSEAAKSAILKITEKQK